MDDSDRQILAFTTNITFLHQELMQLGVQNTEFTVLRIEQKLDKFIAGKVIPL
jgi:hypothetical protein